MRSSIGPYSIQRELGRGGMGVVYLAIDTRLERKVAVKSLPADLAADPDRLARFQREAKMLASLNHPGVGGIYGVESSDGHQYLVLEYIEGETLATRLERGPIPVDEALTLAARIAEALEAAHEKGVVHRDLKPGNVMITPASAAKVLDFGLARTADDSPLSAIVPAIADSPTITTPVRHSPTIPGVIMGTAGYMSPEQARGKPVDKRSDIFSFGCVLYEMLTGAGPFQGDTVADVIGATLHREPDFAVLPSNMPRRVRDLLTSCLAKDRKNRLHDIGDARLELERAITEREWDAVQSGVQTNRSPWSIALTTVAGTALLLLGAVGAWLILGRQPTVVPQQSFHVSTTVPAVPELDYVVDIAPDARFVLYRAVPQLEADSIKPEGVLVVRWLNRDETRVIEGSEGVMEASLSADGRWIAFVAAIDRAQSKVSLKKIALDDGRPVGMPETLCDLPTRGNYTLCWASDREIVLASEWQQTILAVSAAGGDPRVVLREEQINEIDNWGDLRPLVLGKSILATRWALVGQTVKERMEVVDLASGKRTSLLPNAGGAQLVDKDLIVARRNLNSLIAARLDLSTLQIVGEPVTILNFSNMRRGFFISSNGTLAMTKSASDVSGRRIIWVDEQGRQQAIAGPPRAYGNIMISPDGGRVATNLESANDTELPTDLWVQDLARRTFSRVPTEQPSWDFCWSADGERITYATLSNDESSIWDRRADGSGVAVKLFASSRVQTLLAPLSWSPDGKSLAFLQLDLMKNNADVYMLEQTGASETWVARPFLTSPASENVLRFSPDGEWVCFVADDSGRRELYVQRFSAAGSDSGDTRSGRKQISTSGTLGGGWWSPDGKEIRYFDPDKQVMSVRVQTEPTFSASLPTVLYSIKEFNQIDGMFAPDGRLMLLLKAENEMSTKIDLIVNFMGEVRAKLGAPGAP